ncbi:MAG: type II toxin-antitoxin system HicA family toxin [Halobacteria archaeon]
MSYPPFSGREIVKVMVNSGIYKWVRTRGDHAILKWNPPEQHDAKPRTVPVPLHDEISEGTLKSIGEKAGMKDFQQFKEWINNNR